jgi:putative phosphoesterase
MRVALISDIHANLVALEAVLADLKQQDADQIVCLGDVAASGPQPHGVLQRLQALNCMVVMGNADAWMLEPQEYSGDDPFYRKINELDQWAASQLSDGDRDFLRTFHATVSVEADGQARLLCFHGSPRSNTDLITWETSEAQLKQYQTGLDANLLAGGHTHAQMLRRCGEYTWINPGSVGLCYERRSDGTDHNVPRAEYTLLDWQDGAASITFRRVPFDLDAVRQAALRAAMRSDMPHAEWWASEWSA